MNAIFQKGSIKAAIFLILLTIFVVPALWVYGKYKVEINKDRCMDRIRTLTDYIYIKKGGCTELVQETDLSKLVSFAESATCVCSGKQYVYKPFTGSVKYSLKDEVADRIIMWCPTPCHGGGRIVKWEDGIRLWLPESYFQKIMKAGGRYASGKLPVFKTGKWPKNEEETTD